MSTHKPSKNKPRRASKKQEEDQDKETNSTTKEPKRTRKRGVGAPDRTHVKKACANCRTGHLRCDDNRPCTQCTKRNIACVEQEEMPAATHNHNKDKPKAPKRARDFDPESSEPDSELPAKRLRNSTKSTEELSLPVSTSSSGRVLRSSRSSLTRSSSTDSKPSVDPVIPPPLENPSHPSSPISIVPTPCLETPLRHSCPHSPVNTEPVKPVDNANISVDLNADIEASVDLTTIVKKEDKGEDSPNDKKSQEDPQQDLKVLPQDQQLEKATELKSQETLEQQKEPKEIEEEILELKLDDSVPVSHQQVQMPPQAMQHPVQHQQPPQQALHQYHMHPQSMLEGSFYAHRSEYASKPSKVKVQEGFFLDFDDLSSHYSTSTTETDSGESDIYVQDVDVECLDGIYDCNSNIMFVQQLQQQLHHPQQLQTYAYPYDIWTQAYPQYPSSSFVSPPSSSWAGTVSCNNWDGDDIKW